VRRGATVCPISRRDRFRWSAARWIGGPTQHSPCQPETSRWAGTFIGAGAQGGHAARGSGCGVQR
jgi:hypothetical protein